MRFLSLACLLVAGLGFGQATQSATPAGTAAPSDSAASAAPHTKVDPDTPVITVNGFCPGAAPPANSCKTVITRAQFEKLTEALQPGMPVALRLKVANAYARMMRMAAAAEERGLDKTTAFEEEMHYARMQLLSQDLTRALQEDARQVSDAAAEDYYRKNEASYQQATLARIFIPHAKHIPAGDAEASNSDAKSNTALPNDGQEEAVADAMAKLAADLRARAEAGEDPDKLQIEAYAAAGIPEDAPHTKIENVRRGGLTPRHEAVMDLKPGEVSTVLSDPEGAYFIYKMISKQTLSLAEVQAEIRNQITAERYRDSMKRFEGGVVFNDAYFVQPAQAAATPHRHHKTTSTQLPTLPADDHE